MWTVERVFAYVQQYAQEVTVYAWHERLQHRVFFCTPRARVGIGQQMLASMRTLYPCPEFMQRVLMSGGCTVLARGGYIGGWEQLIVMEDPTASAVREFRHETGYFSRALESVAARLDNRITRLPG